MKNKILKCFLLLICLKANSQQSQWHKFTLNSKLNFVQMQDSIDDYFTRNPEFKESENENEGSEFSKYQQWKWFWESRLTEDGKLPSSELVQNAFLEAKAIQTGQRAVAQSQCPWNYIDITSNSGGYWGMGRTTSIAFDPGNYQIFYLSCPGGGVWKTTNGGASYTCMDVGLPYGATSFLKIDPTNPNTLYVSNGDHDGWWQYSTGIYKSIDAGLTWNPTGLNTAAVNTAIYALDINPINSNELLVATSSGLYKSINAGVTFSLISPGSHYDVKYMPFNGNTIYKIFNSAVHKSTNGGNTWNQLFNLNNNNWRAKLVTTSLDPNRIAVASELQNNPLRLHESINGGANFVFRSNLPESYYLSYSPLNVNIFFNGGVNNYVSNNQGVNWTQISKWANGVPAPPNTPVVHADVHDYGISNNPQHLYVCNDGGVYKLNLNNGTWTELSNGLLNHLIYRIGNATNSSVFMLSGTQDNGGRKRIGANSWTNVNGGDGMEVAIKPGDTSTYYTTYVNGRITRHTNSGANQINITQNIYNSAAVFTAGISKPVGKWVTPYDLLPQNPKSLIAGYDTIFKSCDQGNTWFPISGNLSGGWKIDDLEISPTDSNRIYACEGNRFYRTINSGATWSTTILPTSYRITRIAVHPTNSNIVWITRGGYNSKNSNTPKVYKSVDGGTTWQVYSTGLPDVPHNTIIYQNMSADRLFVANDLGVYYRDSTMASWMPFGTNLPITFCNDLKISYSANKIRVATFGRGIYEADLCAPIITNVSNELIANEKVIVYPNPSNGIFVVSNKTIEKLEYIKVFAIDGKLIPAEVTELNSLQSLVKINCAPGVYLVETKVGSKITRLKIINN